MYQKSAKTQVKIHDLMQSRWSPRAFDADRPVKSNDLLALLEAARWAPSCYNDQPWRLIVCDKSVDEVSWQNALTALVEKNRRWAKNAPVLMLATAMNNFTHNGKPNRSAHYDTGAACMSLCLQATALGLIVHQMAGFDAETARKLFQLPDDCTPLTMLAVGYQAEIDVLDDDFVDAELAERSRASIAERFFSGQWLKGLGNDPDLSPDN